MNTFTIMLFLHLLYFIMNSVSQLTLIASPILNFSEHWQQQSGFEEGKQDLQCLLFTIRKIFLQRMQSSALSYRTDNSVAENKISTDAPMPIKNTPMIANNFEALSKFMMGSHAGKDCCANRVSVNMIF
jgi:hypothetical protein